MKIDLIVGARPNFIKAFPVYVALQEAGVFDLRLINTGQHYDKNMSSIFFRQFQMNEHKINLKIGSGSHAEQTGKIMIEIEKVFMDNRPDMVMVFGDVNSTIASALSAVKLRIPVAHVEAGLRSFDRSMPEEVNRLLTDQISDFLFITSPEAKQNLINEGKRNDQIYFVGNTMIDSLVKFEVHFDGSDILKKYNCENKNYILLTLHRPSNVDNIDQLTKVIHGLNKLSESHVIFWPIHPRTKKKIIENKTKVSPSIIVLEPLGYFDFMGLQKEAKYIITDSGGIQEESTYFGVPCFTVRDNTERPITIEDGSNTLVGTDFSKIPDLIQNHLLSMNYQPKRPKYWDGKAGKRLAKIMIEKIS
tara:strand:+ start:421 stop:1503 length:1083 start_codon:yes stop_codon:yes gene_type:complete